METVFSKIVAGKLPCEKVFETRNILAFKDIHPLAPVHILIIPKKSIPNLQSLAKEDLHLMSEIIEAAQIIAKQYGIEDGYRLITNNGPGAGQEVQHLHFHLIGGRPFRSLG